MGELLGYSFAPILHPHPSLTQPVLFVYYMPQENLFHEIYAFKMNILKTIHDYTKVTVAHLRWNNFHWLTVLFPFFWTIISRLELGTERKPRNS